MTQTSLLLVGEQGWRSCGPKINIRIINPLSTVGGTVGLKVGLTVGEAVFVGAKAGALVGPNQLSHSISERFPWDMDIQSSSRPKKFFVSYRLSR
jgi:hypothetical protein